MPTDVDQRWVKLKALAERGRTSEILADIQSEADDATRIALFRSTIRHMAFDVWRNKDLDVMTAVADAAIEDCEQLGGDYLQQANVVCFNASANLADCWSDDFPREPRHFEKGIEYAKKALWFRDHLAKGPGALAMATWALGKHQQSLGRIEEATETFRRCLDLEIQAAHQAGKPAEIDAGAPAGYLIAAGYLGLMTGDRPTLLRLETVLSDMEAAGGEPREEAEIISGQLRETAKQLGAEPIFTFGSRTPT